MRVIYGIGRLKLQKASCVAIGVFDGMHRGHQLIIKKAVAIAKKKNRTSVVVTFYPHPDVIIHTKHYSPLLMSLRHRLEVIRSFGVDICLVVRFDARFRKRSARDFVLDILIRRCHMKDLVVNRMFAFGKHKEGGEQFLKAIAKEIHYTLHLQKVLKHRGKIISSTLIRSLITHGQLKRATSLLGRDIEVIGTVVGGDSRGRKLGFPTANIDPHHEVIPPIGVYLIQAIVGKRTLFGVANIGYRPTFKRAQKEIIELHLLNFKRNIYGRDIRVIFKKRLRGEIHFTHKSILIEQIRKDIQNAHSFFSV